MARYHPLSKQQRDNTAEVLKKNPTVTPSNINLSVDCHLRCREGTESGLLVYNDVLCY